MHTDLPARPAGGRTWLHAQIKLRISINTGVPILVIPKHEMEGSQNEVRSSCAGDKSESRSISLCRAYSAKRAEPSAALPFCESYLRKC
jgi:hypothetical protein